MTIKDHNWSRRKFLKTAGIAGLGSVVAPMTGLVNASENNQTVPTRPFGKTGEQVSILSLGGMFDIGSNQLMLRQAVNWGVTYWDTAHSYSGGRSEKGIGKYFTRYPQDRKKIFLVTKSGAWSLKGMTRELNESLERMRTDYIDLFFVHGIRSISAMDDDIKAWGERAKREGKIRFFGFSTHSNMEECLLEGARLGWIDGIMMTYNYRLMHSDDMRRAVDACVRAGVGLTAMKTQGGGQVRTDSETELKLAGRFLEKGFTDAQTKLKAVWQNPQISSICSQMPNMTILMSNVAAARDKTRLSARDNELMQQYARETRSAYCTGCTDICESCVQGKAPIGDVMRYLMYCNSYDDYGLAAAGFKKIPQKIRTGLTRLDYSMAERKCPQGLPIARLMQEA
ncbi:MAG: aldo/keto reductase, partial [Desulfobacterales bacterium]|nr:aldo/keto reductase [Desulfobacterales bacterium]